MSAEDPNAGGSGEGGAAGELEEIVARLERLSEELGGDLGEERLEELVREASELATRAGAEIERALRQAP